MPGRVGGQERLQRAFSPSWGEKRRPGGVSRFLRPSWSKKGRGGEGSLRKKEGEKSLVRVLLTGKVGQEGNAKAGGRGKGLYHKVERGTTQRVGLKK